MIDKKTAMTGTFYAKAAKQRLEKTSCCSNPTTTLASGYKTTALNAAPEQAVSASFGCGDPVSFSEILPGQTVLDLGCGAGLDLAIAGEKVGTLGHVIGLDASEEMLALAKKNIEQAGLLDRTELRHGTIENLPIADASVDWIISNCVVNLSPDKSKVFSEIYRVLKPGGSAVIADLVADDLPDWVSLHNDLYSSCVSGAVSENTYIDLVSEAGLTAPRILARMNYDKNMLQGLLTDCLPIDIDAIASQLSLTRDDLLDLAVRDLAKKITSIKLRFDRPKI